MEAAAAASTTSSGGDGAGGLIPNQLAVLVPSYDPSKDDLTIYQQKVELLTATWPEGRLIELATRLILNTTGTAFQKLQLNQKEILVNSRKGIEKIIQLLGGSWGRIPLEQKFEAAEKAIYRCQQRGDEANDSFLARADVLWQELLNKQMDVSELQAYIVLRGSLLSSEDKKKVIIDSEVNGSGTLKIDRVQAAIRMLGAGFFQEMTSGKKSSKLKTYDNTILMADEDDEDPNCLISEAVPDEDEMLEQLFQEGDEDAMMITEFENTANEILQDDPQLSSVFSAYTEARRKLSEKFRFRGFFPVSKGKGKPGGKGSWKGKNSRFQGRDRKPLSQRILRSQCRRCLQFGHWKDECPLAKGDGPSSAASSHSGSQANNSFTGSTFTPVPESLPLEFLHLQEFAATVIDDPNVVQEPLHGNHNKDDIEMIYMCNGDISHNRKKSPRFKTITEALHCIRSRSNHCKSDPAVRSLGIPQSEITSTACDADVLLAASQLGPSFGILDTGATKTVIGSQLVGPLIQSLSSNIRGKISRCPCQVVFRFGNLSTLESEQALVIPIGSLFLKIAVVPGCTPFLLSNTLMRALKALIDTGSHKLHSSLLSQSMPLHLTQKGLYMIDINHLAILAEAVSKTCTRETFVQIDHEQCPIEKSTAESGTEVSGERSSNQSDGSPNQNNMISTDPRRDVPSTVDPNRSVLSSSSDQVSFGNSSKLCDRQHVVSLRSPEADPSTIGRASRGHQQILSATDGGHGGRLWSHSYRKDVSGGLGPSPVMDQVVCGALQQEHQTVPPPHDSVHRGQDRTSRDDGHQGATDRWRTSEAQGQSQGHGICQANSKGNDIVRSDGGDRRSLGESGRRDCGWHGTPGGDPEPDRSSADPDAAHGECPANYSEPHPKSGPGRELEPSVDWQWLNAGDPDKDERCCFEETEVNRSPQDSERNRFRKLMSQYSQELQDVIRKANTSSEVSSSILFEVFCSNHSQLTHQCQQLSCKAERFGLAQGDLHTVDGRLVLFQALIRKRPRNLWYSPLCNPWCAFSSLNASKSAEAFADIQAHRLHHIADLALGVVLLRFQLHLGNHMHWEQPSRSLMFRSPLLKEVFEQTWCAQFDLCQIGDLRDPISHLKIKKSLEVLTTSQQMFVALHGHVCRKNHEHQVIEGSIRLGGQTVARSKFTENYPRKFARLVALVLRRDTTKSCVKLDECFAQPESSRRSKYPRLTMPDPARVPRTIAASEMPEPKRRRMLGKQSAVSASGSWSEVFEELNKSIPRVGKRHIDDPNVLSRIQSMVPDKTLKFAVACRGTDRALGPIRPVLPGEAPFRKCLFSHRATGELMIEEHWEQWDNLSQAKILRKGQPCRLNITLFACNSSSISHDGSRTDPSSVTSPVRTEPVEPVSLNPLESETQRRTVTEIIPSEAPIDMSSNQHGPRFLQLPWEDRHSILKAHKNLGHPSNDRLATLLKQQGASATIVDAVNDFKCSVCSMHQAPKHSRPATIKEALDFNDRIAIDGLKFTNSHGHTFHVYHCIDLGTSFHAAIVAPNRSADHAIKCLIQMWLCWAGPPCEIVMDSATEFTSDEFQKFLQSHNIKSRTIPPGAHWQNGRCERHGQVLEQILKKVDVESPIDSYDQLQRVLWHATQAKNSCGLRRGFSPEMLVFGKGSRLPGSLCGDEQLPAHELADSDHAAGIAFRKQLAIREAARKAFHEADNHAALRRAMLRRSCPSRGEYQKGEWIMIWKTSGINKGWFGPMQVVNQDGPHCVWATQGNNLIRCAPEHCRPVSALEAQKLPLGVTSEGLDQLIPRTNNQMNNSSSVIITDSQVMPSPEGNSNLDPVIPSGTLESPPASIVEPQPDQEPEVVSVPGSVSESPPMNSGDGIDIPVPTDDTDDDNLLCVGYRCVEEPSYVVRAEGDSHQAWRLEINVGEKEIQEWREEVDPAEMSFVATAAKKQRSEVRLTDLTRDEADEFRHAKLSEVRNWLKTGTVVKMLRNQISEEEILRCRWVLTWKPIEMSDRDPSNPSKDVKAKARLVVLGYLDPHIEELPRDSPTLGRHSRMLLLQLIASQGWDLRSFDIKAAFLQGQPQDDRLIGLEPCPELAQEMGLKPTEICKLVKSAYGLIDAPFLWYKTLSTALTNLGFETSPFDPCVFVLRDPKTSLPSGIIGIHVDDGLCGGDESFYQKLDVLRKQYPFGSEKVGSFVFTGIQLHQRSDKAIILSQSEYIRKIKPISIDVNRRSTPEEIATDKERQELRALIGSLQYAAVNTRPDLSSRLSMLQSKINSARVETLVEANRVLHEGKRHHDVQLCIQPISCQDFRFLAFSDASFASKANPDSHAGSIILGTHKDISQNVACPISPISWGCKKIQKVVTSTLSAETMSLASTLDQLSWLKLYWAWFLDSSVDWKNPSKSLPNLPEAFSSATWKEDGQGDVAATDCKSLYDLVSRTAAPNCQEYRTQLQARAIKDFLKEGTSLRWVHSGAQLADCLTKIMEASFLRETLKGGQYKLHDETEILKQRANNRSRLQWLRNHGNPISNNDESSTAPMSLNKV